ncbi:MAG TPA: IclR family transcriptional regulator C-terminal domain-containing protein [Woeseiaceae bacterium]|nr:IclR family transcriptional regulator C-terminal domain-containing protein [Woeseiaceae bacterium]
MAITQKSKSSNSAPKKNGEYLTTLARGLSVLRSFTKERPEMTLSEVAAVTALSPAVARRCLNTLVDLGYVGRKGKLFLLTPEVMGFASAFLESMNLEEVVRPYLQEVRDSTGDSSSLAVLSHFDILYLVHVSTNRMVRLVAGFGTRFPAYPTSLGRVLLAHQSVQQVDKYLAEVRMNKLTDKTVTSVSKLRRILNRCRRDGYASIQDELDYGIVSVAVPVFGADGHILAAINCSTATTRVNQEHMVETRLPRLRAAAKSIEIELRRYPILVHSIKSASS